MMIIITISSLIIIYYIISFKYRITIINIDKNLSLYKDHNDNMKGGCDYFEILVMINVYGQSYGNNKI